MDFLSFLEKIKEDYAEYIKSSVSDCESPIEELLAVSLRMINIEWINKYNPFIKIKKLSSQEKIKCKDKTYRVDFLILVEYKNQGTINFVIECDGHEFHQKTKGQVEKDNQRIRDLQEEGYEVIRFSGSEIYYHSIQCALEILHIILSRCKYTKEEK